MPATRPITTMMTNVTAGSMVRMNHPLTRELIAFCESAGLLTVQLPDLPVHGSTIHAGKYCRPYFEIVPMWGNKHLPHLRGFLRPEFFQKCGEGLSKEGLLMSVFRVVNHGVAFG